MPDKIVIASLTGVAYSDGTCDVITTQDAELDFNEAKRARSTSRRPMPDPAPIPATWTRVCGIHIGSGKFSAVWAAHDRTRDVVTIYDEYSVPLGALPVHADAINRRGSWRSLGAEKPGSWIPALIDLDAGGASEREARTAQAQRLADMGVNLADVPADANVGAEDIAARARSHRLQLWTTLAILPVEYQNYRRDEEGELPEGFGLMRAVGLVIGPGLSVAISENVASSNEQGYEMADSSRNPTTGY